MTPIPVALPNDVTCAEMLRPMFREADIAPAWPMRTAEVCELLRSGGGFDVDPQTLEAWSRSGQVGNTVEQGGQIRWHPQNVSLAAAVANASRRWIPGDSRHLGKWAGLEVLEQQAAEAGGTIFEDIDAVDVRTILGVLKGAADHELRMSMCLALEAKLRKAGFIE